MNGLTPKMVGSISTPARWLLARVRYPEALSRLIVVMAHLGIDRRRAEPRRRPRRNPGRRSWLWAALGLSLRPIPGGSEATMPDQVTTITVRDVNIRLHRAGRGPTVLFLHGAGGVPVWLPFFDALADGYELL